MQVDLKYNHINIVLYFKGPKGEAVGSITQPLPSSYLIIRAASESDGKHLFCLS